jgi:hypothetical protein
MSALRSGQGGRLGRVRRSWRETGIGAPIAARCSRWQHASRGEGPR